MFFFSLLVCNMSDLKLMHSFEEQKLETSGNNQEKITQNSNQIMCIFIQENKENKIIVASHFPARYPLLLKALWHDILCRLLKMI